MRLVLAIYVYNYVKITQKNENLQILNVKDVFQIDWILKEEIYKLMEA